MKNLNAVLERFGLPLCKGELGLPPTATNALEDYFKSLESKYEVESVIESSEVDESEEAENEPT